MADLNPEPSIIDEQMDRSICREPAEPDLAKLLEPPGRRPVIGDREVHLKHVSKGTQEALGLPKRTVKDNADRQRHLECDVRVGVLAAGFGTGRSPPGVESGI